MVAASEMRVGAGMEALAGAVVPASRRAGWGGGGAGAGEGTGAGVDVDVDVEVMTRGGATAAGGAPAGTAIGALVGRFAGFGAVTAAGG